ncbi:TolC family protein [bacterium]|nr:TolC family protein [bacterium]
MTRTIIIRPIAVLLILLICLAPTGVRLQAKEVDLDEFVSLVERYSKQLQIAEKDREEADAQKSEAIGLALPHISAQAGYTRNLSDVYSYLDFSALSGEGGVSKIDMNRDNEFTAGVSLRQTLFSGTVFNAIAAARQYRRLTDYTYDATYQQILTLSKQAFSQALLLERVVTVAELAEQNAHDNYLDMKKRFESGLASEFQLLQAESRYRDAVPQTAATRRNLELALVDLKNFAGIPVDTTLELNGSLDRYPQLPKQVDIETVLAQRPDYNAMLWEEQLRKTNVSAQRSGYYPSLSAVAGYGYSAQSNDFKLEEENNSWTVGLMLSVPIYQGGETRAKVRQASVQLDKSRLEIARRRDEIEKEIKSVRLRLEEAHERISSANTALTTARKAFDIAEATARSGLTTQLELKDARVGLDQATVAYYSAVFEYLAAWYDWQRVTGNMNKKSD